MGKFIAGIIFTLAMIVALGLATVQFGWVTLSADARIPRWEQELAERAAEAYVDRHAQKMDNPVPINEATLTDGARIYNQHCAACHGGPADPVSPLRDGFYPRVPQFMRHVHDDEEYKTFHLVKHGIRWTGMPGWGKVLSDEEIWKVVAFVSRMDKLPPAVEAEWKKTEGVTRTQMITGGKSRRPGAAEPEPKEADHSHDHKH